MELPGTLKPHLKEYFFPGINIRWTKFLKFDDVEIEGKKLCSSKSVIEINNININKESNIWRVSLCEKEF